MTTRKKKEKDSSGVVKGSHLTVTTFSDGSTKLEWDDEALLQDVRAAVLTAESTVNAATETKPKKKRKA